MSRARTGAAPPIVRRDVGWRSRTGAAVGCHGGRVFLAALGVEAQRSGHHVLGDLGEGSVVAEGVGPQPDEGLADADVELGGDHARGLVHHVLEVGAGLQLGGELAGRRVGLQHEERLGGDVGHDQRVGVLFVGERPRPVAVQVERPEADRSDLQREAEDGPHARVDGRPGEGEPPGCGRFSQIGFEHGPVLVVGVDAGPLAEVVLQLLDEGAHLVGGAHRAPGHVTGHQHDPRAAHPGDLGAHLAQPFRLQSGSSGADEPVENLQSPFAGHRSRSSGGGEGGALICRIVVVGR